MKSTDFPYYVYFLGTLFIGSVLGAWAAALWGLGWMACFGRFAPIENIAGAWLFVTMAFIFTASAAFVIAKAEQDKGDTK